jgi:hypothetical protein
MTSFVNPDLADKRGFAADDAGQIGLRPTVLRLPMNQEQKQNHLHPQDHTGTSVHSAPHRG